MPNIRGWDKIDNWHWKHRHYDMEATITKTENGWVGKIEDNEFNRFNVQFMTGKYTKTRDTLYDVMRNIDRTINS